ncbi:MAG: Cof-type HAD-IIB family hydrolase, partial [Candidatus Izimaplasma sp.]|nr:Cof-type HAD-IIB family hydrolase [Candidatus Izimaplasma bacterium]
MNKKYIFLDVDGTVIDHKSNSIPESTKETIKKLQENGHIVILSTGRPVSLLYGIDKELNIDTFIASNGRVVVCEGKLIHNDYIDKEVVKKVVKVALENKIDLAFESMTDYVLNTRYSNISDRFSDIFHLEYPKVHRDYHLDNDIYQMILFYNKDDYKKYENLFPTLSFHYSNEYGIDINEKGGMKDIGVRAIVEYLDIDIKDTIAVGDGFNDVSMIEYAHIGVAMG